MDSDVDENEDSDEGDATSDSCGEQSEVEQSGSSGQRNTLRKVWGAEGP